MSQEAILHACLIRLAQLASAVPAQYPQVPCLCTAAPGSADHPYDAESLAPFEGKIWRYAELVQQVCCPQPPCACPANQQMMLFWPRRLLREWDMPCRSLPTSCRDHLLQALSNG